MKKLQKILAWACAVNMIFGNVSVTNFAAAETPDETVPEVVSAAENTLATIRVGGRKTADTDTVMSLKAEKDQDIIVFADHPVSVSVERDGSKKSFRAKDGKLEAELTVAPGEYTLTFSGDAYTGTFTVEVWDAAEYRQAKAPAQAEAAEENPGEAAGETVEPEEALSSNEAGEENGQPEEVKEEEKGEE